MLALVAGTFAALTGQTQAYPLQTLTTNAQPLCGTANDGDTFPGAVAPFGMVQWSPDTTSLDHSGGYFYNDTAIIGFSLDHLSGAGCGYGGNFAFTPILGSVTNSPGTNGNNGRTAFVSTFSHANETATPGYYSVIFSNGIRTELTTTTRTGFGRFTFPAGTPSMVVNAASGAAGTINASIQINPSGTEISGWTIENTFCGANQRNTVYFDAVFDQAFASFGEWNGGVLTANATNSTGAATGVYLTFNLPNGGVVLVRTAISYVSVANAQANLKSESPVTSFTSAGFDDMVGAVSNTWNSYLNKIQITGGTESDRATFYTMMYHGLLAPSVVSDVNGQYMGFDGQVHSVSGFNKYEYFSGWDIYRSECQLLAMIDPARAGDMAQSLVLDAHEGGAMPRWSVPDGDSGVMMGDPATPIIAGMYAFGATNFDTASALGAMVKAAINPATMALNGINEREAERDYLNLGYVPAAENGGYGPVSMTLEYCSDDFALGRFAQALGDTTNYTLAMNRAQNWRNLFNPSSGYLQMRNSDALWSPGYPIYSGKAYVEGTAYQYVWMVPFNLASLTDLMGGPAAASARLDKFYTQINDGDTTSSPYAYMGNEPCAAMPWIYSFVGEPYKSSRTVRRIVSGLYSTAPGGLPGNDDLGQMASWYVFAALGMYPALPGDDVLVLNGPLFPEAVVHLTNGDLTITGAGAADDAPYIQSFSTNGQPSTTPWLRFANIANGGTLAFTMGATADTNWGSNLLLAPPSYTDGMTTPLAQTYLWGTGIENGEPQPTWTNTIDVASPGGGSANIGPVTSGPSGAELGVRGERSQSGSEEIMYSGRAQGGVADYAYLKAFDLSEQGITVSSGMHFSYWVFPQSHSNDGLAAGTNSAYVALDLVFTDGTDLRDSGLVDQHGVSIHPSKQRGILALDNWNYVTVDLSPLAGKTVNRLDFGYDQPNSRGEYRGYVDDIAFTTPANGWTNNLALNQPASADSQQAGNPAISGNDGNMGTQWTANDGNPNHWWQVDLGYLCNLTADEVIWSTNGAVYDYTVAISIDGTNWTPVVDKSVNPSTAQDQSDIFLGAARYVRITFTGLPAGEPAGFSEFRVFGTKIVLPATPNSLQASGGYGLISLSWTGSPDAKSYDVERSTLGGAETWTATVAVTNFTDLGLSNGTAYFYVVSAQNLLGKSSRSSEVSATPLAPIPGSFDAAVLADHPLAYWHLAETNGATAFDLVGGHNGTYVGGVTPGQPGAPLAGFITPNYAPLFDGISGYVDIPNGPFNITNAITTVAWVNVPAVPHFSGIIGHGDSSWRMSINESGQPAGSDGGTDTTSPTSIVGANWHLVAFTYTGVPEVGKNGSLYVDGILTAQSTIPAIMGNQLDVYIGGAPDYGAGRLLPGSIARAAVFTNLLSAAQVSALYQAGTNNLPPEL